MLILFFFFFWNPTSTLLKRRFRITMKKRKDLIEILILEQAPRLSKIKLCIKWRLSWAGAFKFYGSLEEVLPLV